MRLYRLVLPVVFACAVALSFTHSPTAQAADEVQSRIIGGTVAPDGDWPHQSALMLASRTDPLAANFCGGTLIAPSWVLTAAHCVTWSGFPGGSGLEVSVGINNLLSVTAADRIGVEGIYVHPGYDSGTDESNDFALLLLKAPSVRAPATLITAAQSAGGAAAPPNTGDVAGWGSTSAYLPGDLDPPASFPTSLMEAKNLPFISDDTCGAQYDIYFDPAVMLCAGELGTEPDPVAEPGRDTCQGDSGGPIMANLSGGGRVLAGVTSFGAGCGTRAYGVYAKVASALDWIATTTDSFPLSVQRAGTGSGQVTSSPAGISCGTDCTESYAEGTLVTLAATAGSGSSFSGWEGAGCSGTGSCVVTMSQVRSVTASFTADPPAPAPAPAPPTPPSPPPTPENEFTLGGQAVRVTGSTVAISSRASVLAAGLLEQRAVARPRRGRSLRCSTSRSVAAAGSYALRCNLGTAGRRALKRSSLSVTLATTFAPRSGLPEATRTLKFTISRRR